MAASGHAHGAQSKREAVDGADARGAALAGGDYAKFGLTIDMSYGCALTLASTSNGSGLFDVEH